MGKSSVDVADIDGVGRGYFAAKRRETVPALFLYVGYVHVSSSNLGEGLCRV